MLPEGGVPIPDWSLLAAASAPGVVKRLQCVQSKGPCCPCRAGLQCRQWLTPVLLSSAWRLQGYVRACTC